MKKTEKKNSLSWSLWRVKNLCVKPKLVNYCYYTILVYLW